MKSGTIYRVTTLIAAR